MTTFACPRCGDILAGFEDGLRCGACGTVVKRVDGIYRCLSPERLADLQPFFRQYRLVREKDGYRSPTAEYYRSLPYVRGDDPQAAAWRVRQETFQAVQQRVLPLSGDRRLSIVELGAGNGWLSHRLSLLGHEAVAVDLLDDDEDGLGACKHYETPFTRVQADFDSLPFRPRQFALVIFNGSLHYSPDPARTVRRASGLLAPGGRLLVMDSPMFRTGAAGDRMWEGKVHGFRTEYGVDEVVRLGLGYVTFPELSAVARELKLSPQFFPSRGGLIWAARRLVGRIKMRRDPATFGLWLAHQAVS